MTRNQHERATDIHDGMLLASIVELSQVFGGLPEGSNLQEAIEWLNGQIVDLEMGRRRGNIFSVQAISKRTTTGQMSVSALLFGCECVSNGTGTTCTGSLLVDAALMVRTTASYSLDSRILYPWPFTVNSVLLRPSYNSTVIDAEIGQVIAAIRARVSQMSLESIVKRDNTPVRLSQSASEVVVANANPQTRVSQIADEVLVQRSDVTARASQVAIEVLITT